MRPTIIAPRWVGTSATLSATAHPGGGMGDPAAWAALPRRVLHSQQRPPLDGCPLAVATRLSAGSWQPDRWRAAGPRCGLQMNDVPGVNNSASSVPPGKSEGSVAWRLSAARVGVRRRLRGVLWVAHGELDIQ